MLLIVNKHFTTLRAALLGAITLSSMIFGTTTNAGPGGALSFNGTAGQCVTATIPALSSNYTVSAWVYLLAGGDYSTMRVGVLTGVDCGGSAEMTVQNQSYVYAFGQYLMLGRCGYYNGMCSSSEVPLNEWVHLAMTIDSAQDVTYYINGVIAGGYTAGAGSNLTIGPEIHLADNSVRMFNGSLAEVQIWRRVLSGGELLSGMNQAPNVADTNLVGYWSFDEGSGTTASNSAMATGSACDGTLVNSPGWAWSGVAFAPDAGTGGATGVGATGATLNGAVNPCNLPTTAWFQWGADTNYGNVTTAATLGSGSQALAVSNVLTNLAVGATYHYQVVATNALGITRGADQSFATRDVSREITGSCLTATGQFQFQFTGAAGSSYTVLGTTNLGLALGSWIPVGTAAETAPGQYQFTDPAGMTNQPQRFYLLRQP
jgi:hypothetical protein